jgi:hypothetical protein
MILKKLGTEYKLYSHDSCIATTQESPHKRLSKENCDEMFGVVNLMKLAEEHSHKYYDVKTTDWHSNYNGFFSGFLKAIELNKDKLFTLEDILDVWELGAAEGLPLTKSKKEKLLKSLQQPTEIGVEIEMENYVKYVSKSLETIFPTGGVRPKLDENGCLILKKK